MIAVPEKRIHLMLLSEVIKCVGVGCRDAPELDRVDLSTNNFTFDMEVFYDGRRDQ
jgi:hypothetical protein